MSVPETPRQNQRLSHPAEPNNGATSRSPLEGASSESRSAEPPKLASIAIPKGGGAIRSLGEKFAVNAATGSCGLSIPLPFSAGRSGSAPGLALTYDSNAGNGSLGLGWALGLPAITRKTDKGLPRYNDQQERDTYIFSGNEDLVPLLQADGTTQSIGRMLFGVAYEIYFYRPRIEGLYARIERWAPVSDGYTFWRVISRDNVTSLLGYDQDSLLANPAAQEQIYAWNISRSWDDRGNLILYHYLPENSAGVDAGQPQEANRTPLTRSAQVYLHSIQYGNVQPYLPDWSAADEQPLPTAWMFETVLDYGDHTAAVPTPASDGPWQIRSDPFSTYRPGFEVRTYRRISRFLFFHNLPGEITSGADRLVRSLNLTYADEQQALALTAPLYSLLAAVTERSYGDGGATRDLPPLTLTYSQAVLREQILTLDPDSLGNLPEGLNTARERWVDLDGEGLPGILSGSAAGWYYKRNTSANNLVAQPDGSVAARARLGLLEVVRSVPSNGRLFEGGPMLMDVTGDGMLDLVEFDAGEAGYFERSQDGQWLPYQSFPALPRVDWQDANLKFIDVTGDGLADVLITEDGLFTFYPSLGADGFDQAEQVRTPWDEELGPKVVLADGTETIFLADMSGDGLNDIVRVRNGETCYWPNLGYGRFGAKVSMGGAPRFDSEEQFDPARIRLADIDGTGAADLLYVARDGVRAWFNQSGNQWSAANVLAIFPSADSLSTAQVIDLLGTGTACLVWSSPLPSQSAVPLRYVDLMGGQKPHLLVGSANNLGAETRVTYAPSTRFFREDADAGTPWETRLPFPVQVIERVELIDWIGRSRLVTRYAYHHGFYDGYEREFRGFGRVEQWDTEEFRSDVSFNDGEFVNWDQQSWSPPVRTVSWFHTGAFLQSQEISRQFATEYWAEPALSMSGTAGSMNLPDSTLPLTVGAETLDAYQLQESCRALKGHPLRVEIYAQDGSPLAANPYTVTEHNYAVTCLQLRGPNLHAIFAVEPRETLTATYERSGTDPRVAHAITLETDDYGNPLRTLSVAYGRRPGPLVSPPPAAALPQLAYDQQRLHIQAIQQIYTQAIDDLASTPDVYRAPLPSASQTAEITGITPAAEIPGVTNLFTFGELDAWWTELWTGASDIPYEQLPSADIAGAGAPTPAPARRFLSGQRVLYRSDDLSTLLPPGQIESRALPGQSYGTALTDGLLSAIFDDLVTPAILQGLGYVQLGGETGWWIPSARVYYSPGDTDTPAEELANAQQHFFLPRRVVDPLGFVARVDFDAWDLLPQTTTDAVGNATAAENNYRVLGPTLVTDPNGNRTAFAFDALGMVTATAVMGKTTEALGDLLTGFTLDLDDATLADLCADPLSSPATLLGNATTRTIYDLLAYLRSSGSATPLPAVAYTVMRETHISDLAEGVATRFQYRLAYFDGLERTVQKKSLVAPGPLTDGGVVTSPRWVGSGWAVFNNKGNPVRQYEPFFTASSGFEFAAVVGVSTVLLYDAAGRNVASLRPDSTWTKTVFDTWSHADWDGNDTVLLDPRADGDVGAYFSQVLPAGWVSWHDQRITNSYGATAEEQAAQYDAARKTEAHASTPSRTWFDSASRNCLLVVDNGDDALYASRTAYDAAGKPLLITDALGRQSQLWCLAGQGAYTAGIDMAGNPLYTIHADTNERRTLSDVYGNMSRWWDARGSAFRTEYDPARRPTARYVSAMGAPETLLELSIYGEPVSALQPAANLRGRLFRHYDGAGFADNLAFDYKGNLLSGTRQLAAAYRQAPDWSPLAALTEPSQLDTAAQAAGLIPSVDSGRDLFTSSTMYDALNRTVQSVTPHNASMLPNVLQTGFDEGGELTLLDAWIGVADAPAGLLDGTTADQHAVTGIAYNARGERAQVSLGNGTQTVYAYDPETFRLARLTTTRPPSVGLNAQTVQDLLYFYDPVGNITRIRDDADTQNVVFFRNQRVEPSADYTCDPLYRLISASGREHLGQTGNALAPPQQVTNDDSSRTGLLSPGDGNAMGLYTESYEYDAVGNLLSMLHQAASGSWRRGYSYQEPSWILPGETGNRLSGTTLPGDAATGHFSATYAYDVHGSMVRMPHLPAVAWDQDDRLLSTTRQVVNGGTPETTYYTYAAEGARVRKATDLQAAAGVAPARKSERIYLGTVEVYREFESDGTTITLLRETLHIAAGAEAIARVETRTLGTDTAPAQQVRYQYVNLLGSAVLELDDAASVLSYEEYFPFGSTSYQAVSAQTNLPKRYRFTGKERDSENDLSYHGARYYAPWLGRWISCDPKGMVDGTNLYAYARNNPARISDPNGKEGKDTQEPPLSKDVKKGADQALRLSAERGVPHMRAHIPMVPELQLKPIPAPKAPTLSGPIARPDDPANPFPPNPGPIVPPPAPAAAENLVDPPNSLYSSWTNSAQVLKYLVFNAEANQITSFGSSGQGATTQLSGRLGLGHGVELGVIGNLSLGDPASGNGGLTLHLGPTELSDDARKSGFLLQVTGGSGQDPKGDANGVLSASASFLSSRKPSDVTEENPHPSGNDFNVGAGYSTFGNFGPGTASVPHLLNLTLLADKSWTLSPPPGVKSSTSSSAYVEGLIQPTIALGTVNDNLLAGVRLGGGAGISTTGSTETEGSLFTLSANGFVDLTSRGVGLGGMVLLTYGLSKNF